MNMKKDITKLVLWVSIIAWTMGFLSSDAITLSLNLNSAELVQMKSFQSILKNTRMILEDLFIFSQMTLQILAQIQKKMMKMMEMMEMNDLKFLIMKILMLMNIKSIEAHVNFKRDDFIIMQKDEKDFGR